MVANHFPQDESNSHNPVLLPLYHQFLSTLYDVCSPFTKDPNELAYIASARWPGFVSPILDEYRRLLDEGRDNSGDEEEEFELTAPTEDARIRLIRLFTPSFTTALEALYPRLSNAAEWAADNQPQRNLLSSGFTGANLVDKSVLQAPQGSLPDVLPRMSKFVLLAAFLASTNPVKSDLRMFGRALHERKKRKRGIAASSRVGAVKVSSDSSLWSPGLTWDRSHKGTSDLSSFRWTGYLLSSESYLKNTMWTLVLPLQSISFLGNIRTWRSGACRRIQGYVYTLTNFLVRFALLTQGPDHGAHSYEVVATSVSARTARWTADVQVCNNVRGDVKGSEGFGCPTERFDFRANLELKLKAETSPLCYYIILTMGSVANL